MSWDFFTNSTAPWWATVALPIVTLLVGQHVTSIAAREQRQAEIEAAKDLRKDEADSRAAERDHDRATAEANRRAAASAAEEARFNGVFDAAQYAIHALQAELAAFAGTSQLDDDALRRFAVAVGHLRIHVLQEQKLNYQRPLATSTVDDLNPAWAIQLVVQLRAAGTFADEPTITAIVQRLSRLADGIYELRETAAEVRAASSS